MEKREEKKYRQIERKITHTLLFNQLTTYDEKRKQFSYQ